MYAQINNETDEVEAHVNVAGCLEGRSYFPLNDPIDWSGRTSETAIVLWNGGNYRWHDPVSLKEARANAWASAKVARDAAEAADFDYGGVLYQPDVARITGAVLEAMLPRAEDEPPFSIDWTVSDNSVVTLNAAQMVGLGRTLAARMSAIHHKGRLLRALIDNATTPAEAYGYTWNSLDADE